MWAGFLEWFVVHLLAQVFPKRYRVIPRKEDGVPLLRQFRLWGSPSAGSGAYLQSFVNPEMKEDFHNHRWLHMRSFVLSNYFVEERYPGGLFIVHEAPSTYTMDNAVIHRLASVDPKTWTLFITRGPITDWGYYKRPETVNYVAFRDVIPPEHRVNPL